MELTDGVVVICLKNRTFAVYKTTLLHLIVHAFML